MSRNVDDRTPERKAQDDAIRQDVEARGSTFDRAPAGLKRATVALARNAKARKKKSGADPEVGGAQVVRTFRLAQAVRQAMGQRAARDGFSHLVDAVQVLMTAFVRGHLKPSSIREFSLEDPRRTLRGSGGLPTWNVKLDAGLYERFKEAAQAAGMVPSDCVRALATAYAVDKVSLKVT